MVNIQSPTAETRRGKKEERTKKERKKQGENIMVCPITYGNHNKHYTVHHGEAQRVSCASLLWPLYGIGQAVVFSCCGFYLLSSFFPRLISAVGDWMSTILSHMLWP